MPIAPTVIRNPKRSSSAAEFERECILFFEDIVRIFGIPRSVGQIYGLLYASPTPLGFPDIVERLEISKGSASQGLQLLRSLGAIVEADASGAASSTRAAVYQPELSLRQLVTGVLREQIVPLASIGSARVGCLREIASMQSGDREFFLERVRQLETWRRRFATVLPLLTALLGPKKRK